MTPETVETFLRTAGGVFQLGGVWTVAWEIHRTHQRFAPERVGRLRRVVRRRARRLWRWLSRRRPEPVTLQARSATESADGLSAYVTVSRDPDKLDLEGKVEELFRRERQLSERLDRLGKQHGDRLREHGERLETERCERTAATVELGTKVRDLATGGVRIRWYGVALLTVGVALLTWAPEMAGVLTR